MDPQAKGTDADFSEADIVAIASGAADAHWAANELDRAAITCADELHERGFLFPAQAAGCAEGGVEKGLGPAQRPRCSTHSKKMQHEKKCNAQAEDAMVSDGTWAVLAKHLSMIQCMDLVAACGRSRSGLTVHSARRHRRRHDRSTSASRRACLENGCGLGVTRKAVSQRECSSSVKDIRNVCL